MLIEFSVGNYRSFKESVTLSMLAADLNVPNEELNTNNLFVFTKDDSLLKSSAIYGANASGKSNLIKAISFMRWFVTERSIASQSTDRIDVESFKLSTDTVDKPSYFEVVFFLKGKLFRYGFEVDTQRVHEEWLYQTENGEEETNLFWRESGEFSLSDLFTEGEGLTGKTRGNALFLSVVDQFNGAISQSILAWFQKLNIISGLSDTNYGKFTIQKMENGKWKDRIISFVKRFDLGISDMQIEKTDLSADNAPKIFPVLKNLFIKDDSGKLDALTVITHHKQYDSNNKPISIVSFELDKNESEGTQKLFYLSGLILDTLQSGNILIIDEFDARLHPLITAELIQLFNSKTTNPHNAQLLFATHDASLLNSKFFRRDQVWFTEKTKFGVTNLYSLAEFKIPDDDLFHKDYMSGRYGGIPFIGGLHYLTGDTDG
jgi:uncharacterized protein